MLCRDFAQATVCHADLANLNGNLLAATKHDGKDTILFNELIKKMPSKLKATKLFYVPLVLLILNTISNCSIICLNWSSKLFPCTERNTVIVVTQNTMAMFNGITYSIAYY